MLTFPITYLFPYFLLQRSIPTAFLNCEFFVFPERLQITNINANVEGTISSKAKYKPVTNIIDWNQCFGLYIAVLSCSQPEIVTDLLGYQTLIIQACMVGIRAQTNSNFNIQIFSRFSNEYSKYSFH